jgi:hypothetical protein
MSAILTCTDNSKTKESEGVNGEGQKGGRGRRGEYVSVVMIVGVFCLECFSQNSSAPKCKSTSLFSLSNFSLLSFSLARRCCSNVVLPVAPPALLIPEKADKEAKLSVLAETFRCGAAAALADCCWGRGRLRLRLRL